MCGKAAAGSVQGPMAGFCKHLIELAGFMLFGGFLHRLSDHQLLKVSGII